MPPVFDSGTQTKLDALRVIYLAGTTIEVHEMVRVDWPSPDGAMWYATDQIDESATVAPDTDGEPIYVRLLADDETDSFFPLNMDATIGDEEVDLDFWDADEDIATKLNTHGEGVTAEIYYWFPQVELLLSQWQGHFEYGDEEDATHIAIRAVQGFRSSDSTVPTGGHYPHCSAVFGGLFETQAEIDEGACPYNKQISGGTIGNNDPDTGLPWTYCDRRTTQSCTDRAVDPKYHFSHRTTTRSVQNPQSSGPNLTSTSVDNTTGLEEPVVVVMGKRRRYGFSLLGYRRDLNNATPDRGWFLGQYEVCRGPVQSLSQFRFKVGDKEKPAESLHLGYRYGFKGEIPYSADNWQLTTHTYSLVATAKYNFGWINAEEVDPKDATGSCLVEGLRDIRVYTDATTYTLEHTSNRAWQIAKILCDKIWGFGLDYSRLDIDSFIEAADWCEEFVRYTDPFDTDWDHVRSDSHVELIGRKVQQQIDDMCIAGRLSKPFMFQGKIHIVPLRKLTSGELADCPVFTDEGDSPNIIWEGEPGDETSTLKITKRLSVKDLANRIECKFDNAANDWLNVPLRPVEDEDAQLAAGRLFGDSTRKINKKEYNLMGVTSEAQAIKLAWTLLDLGPCDEGGLRNNLPLKFSIWFADALELHPDKVIKVVSSKLTKYGFEYFRVKSITRQPNLFVEITCQAYNEDYMDTLESTVTPVEPTYCTLDSDCPDGFVCVDGVCVIEPLPCRPGFGTISYANGTLTVPIEPC